MVISNKRILIEIEQINSATQNFKYGFKRFLDYIGAEYRFKKIEDIIERDLNWCDVYISVRPNTPMSVSIAKAIKRSRRLYIVYFDDDLVNRNNSLKWRKDSSQKCLELSDAVFGANPTLCADYGRFSKKSFSINTFVEECELSYLRRDNSIVKFVYAAGKDHAETFELIVKPALKQIMNEYHDRIHFTFIGVEPRIEDIGFLDNFTFIPMMSLQDYANYMKENAFDVGVAPLINSRFSRMKYFNKYIEYSKFGIAGIYSNVEPYIYAIHNKENGYLIDNKINDWIKCLKYCIDNIDDVRKIGENAQNDLRKNYSFKEIVDELQNNFNSIEDNNECLAIRWDKNIIVSWWFGAYDMFWKIFNHIMYRGINETFKMIIKRYF